MEYASLKKCGWNMQVSKIVYILGRPHPSSPKKILVFSSYIPPPYACACGSVGTDYKKFFQKIKNIFKKVYKNACNLFFNMLYLKSLKRKAKKIKDGLRV